MGFEHQLRRLALARADGWVRPLVIALICVTVGALLRLAVTPLLGNLSGATLFIPAVVVASLWGGRFSGYATLVGGVAVTVLLANLPGRPVPLGPALIGIGLFTGIGLFVAEVSAALRRTLASEAAAVDQLRDGQQSLGLAHEAGRLGAWEWDIASDTLRLSQGYLRNWRILAQDTFPFTELARKVHPDDLASVMESRRRVLEERQPYRSEYRVIGDDGQVRWFASQGNVELDASGRPLRVHGVNREITAEVALRESEARFRTMADSAPSPVWVTRAEGGVEFVNAAFCEFFGGREEELLGDAWMERLHPDDREATLAIYREKRGAREPYEFEARFRVASGDYRWLTARCRPRLGKDGVFMGYVGIAFDTTDDREARTALQESEARFRLIADRAPVNLWMGDENGACVFLNRAQREFWGLGEDYLDTFQWSDSLHPDDAAGLFEIFQRAMAAHEPFTVEARYRRADGEWRVLQTQAQPRFDGAGQFVGMIGVNVDITDPRMAEAALRESEARFRAMADAAPAPIWVSGPNGDIVFVNQATKEFFGRGRGPMRQAWKERVHPDDLPGLLRDRDAARDRGEGFSFQARLLDRHKQWRWLRGGTRPRFDSEGQFQGYVGIAFDVTDAVEAQDALLAQERRQRFQLQFGDGLRESDDPRAIAAFAERALGAHLQVARVGYGELDDATGTMSVRDSWTNGELEPISGVYTLESYGARLMAELQRGRTVRIADTGKDPRTAESADAFKGQGVRARLSVPVVRAGRVRAVFFLHDTAPRDWSDEDAALVEEAASRTWTEIERARALAEVRESEERFRSIANSAPILVWVTNADRKRAFVNQTYVEFMGASYEEALDRDWREFLHPDDWTRILKEQMAGEGSLKPFSLEARYKRADGAWRWLRSYSRPRFGQEGELLGFVGAAYDVTEERQVQADLEHINELLAERVAQALAEKEQAEAALIRSQKLEALGRLTGGVAHDFNNLLTVVVGALDMILKHPDDAAKRARMAEAAMAAARRGEQLTHQLLAFSRRQALRPALSDVNALIRESEPLIRRAVGENVDFACELCEGEAVVRVDPAQFEAALFNLVVNARDATPEGGRIDVRTERCDLAEGEVSDVPAGHHVRISIHDTGAGMSPEVVARVFEPFFTTKPQGKGTGLGLSQVYGFAQQSGGGVSLDSVVGEGTTIAIYLPATAEALPRPEPTETSPAENRDGPLKVLLVEDDREVAAIAETMLRHLGHEVTQVASGARALVKLRSGDGYDLLLTDVVMPGGMDGVELARRAVEMHPGLRVVLTSGYAGEAVDRTLVDAPWPFLRKPYSQEELVRLLSAAVPAPAKPPARGRKPSPVKA